jgi:hypothetical protein
LFASAWTETTPRLRKPPKFSAARLFALSAYLVKLVEVLQPLYAKDNIWTRHLTRTVVLLQSLSSTSSSSSTRCRRESCTYRLLGIISFSKLRAILIRKYLQPGALQDRLLGGANPIALLEAATVLVAAAVLFEVLPNRSYVWFIDNTVGLHGFAKGVSGNPFMKHTLFSYSTYWHFSSKLTHCLNTYHQNNSGPMAYRGMVRLIGGSSHTESLAHLLGHHSHHGEEPSLNSGKDGLTGIHWKRLGNTLEVERHTRRARPLIIQSSPAPCILACTPQKCAGIHLVCKSHS